MPHINKSGCKHSSTSPQRYIDSRPGTAPPVTIYFARGAATSPPKRHQGGIT